MITDRTELTALSLITITYSLNFICFINFYFIIDNLNNVWNILVLPPKNSICKIMIITTLLLFLLLLLLLFLLHLPLLLLPLLPLLPLLLLHHQILLTETNTSTINWSLPSTIFFMPYSCLNSVASLVLFVNPTLATICVLFRLSNRVVQKNVMSSK